MSGTRHPLGVLVLHGFSASPDTVAPLVAPLEALGVPVRVPVFRGHGAASPEALRGVGWTKWVADGAAALEDLLGSAEKAVVVGHSMGGLVALALAGKRREVIDSLVLAAAAVQLGSPLAPGRPLSFLAPLVLRLLRSSRLTPKYADPLRAAGHPGYRWAPTESIASLFDFSRQVRRRLGEVREPVLILQSRRDTTVSPRSALVIHDGIATPAAEKRIVWFERTEHGMFLDCESDEVIRTVVEYVRERMTRIS